MKASILLSMFCLLTCLAMGQTAPEGTSLRNTIFANRFKEIDAIKQRSNATVNNKVSPPAVPMRENVFKNYKPVTPAPSKLTRVSTSNIPSDNKTQKGRDSIRTKLVIPNQGSSSSGKN